MHFNFQYDFETWRREHERRVTDVERRAQFLPRSRRRLRLWQAARALMTRRTRRRQVGRAGDAAVYPADATTVACSPIPVRCGA